MLCILEIALLVWGIMTLAKGKISLTKKKMVRGTAAYLIGVLFILPLPVAFLAGMVLGIAATIEGKGQPDPSIMRYAPLIEIVIFVGLTLTAIVIGFATGKSEEEWSLRTAQDDPRRAAPILPDTDPNNPYRSPSQGR